MARRSGSLPLAGRVKEGVNTSHVPDTDQREFARALRNQSTDAEKRLWHFLRAGQLRGRKFRRQAAIGPYVVDFVCFADKLIVELDSPQYLEPEAVEQDKRRTNWLASRGFRVVRFRNQELDENIRAVVDAIGRAIDEMEAAKSPSPFASRFTTALRSGDFRSPVPVWSRPRRWNGARREIGCPRSGLPGSESRRLEVV